MEKIKEIDSTLVNEVNEKIKRIVEVFKNGNMDEYTNYECENNVISFVGERGSGKTFTMLSLAKEKKEEAYVLDIIEPELFENKTMLLEMIVVKMYNLFKEELKKNKNICSQEKWILELTKKFIDILKNIKIYFEKRDDYYEKEISINLFEITNSFNLKAKFRDLVEEYILTMNKITHKKCNYLLILIDDMDLNYKNAYSVLEQIRKFLIIPRLINFIAYKESQLTLLLENEFSEIEKIDTAQKYLKKVFPYENKIYTKGKQELIKEEKASFDDINTKLCDLFPNIENKQEYIEIFYPDTYRELNALKKFFNIEGTKVNLDKYIKFLSGHTANEINKKNIKRDYLKEIFEIEKKLEEELSIDELKNNLLKKEQLLQSKRKVNKFSLKLLDYANKMEDEYYFLDKENIFLKENFLRRDYSAAVMLKDEPEIKRIKDKALVIDFIDQLFSNENYINPIKIILDGKDGLTIKKTYDYLNEIKNVKSVNDFFDTILRYRKKSEIEKISQKLKINSKLNRKFCLTLFLNDNFYKKTKCNNLDEIILLIITLKEMYWLELNIFTKVYKITNFERGIKEIEDIEKKLKFICKKIPSFQDKLSFYLKKSYEAKRLLKRVNIMNLQKIKQDDTNKQEIESNFELTFQTKYMEIFEGIGKIIEIELERIEIFYEDNGWIEANYTKDEINEISLKIFGEIDG